MSDRAAPRVRPVSAEGGAPDLRSWMRELEIAGCLRRVAVPVDSPEEMAALARAALAPGGPALLFETPGRDGGGIVTGALAAPDRVRLLLRLARDTPDRDIVRHLKYAYRRPLPPRVAAAGAVARRVLDGDAADAAAFSIPTAGRRGAEPSFAAACGVVTRNPRTGRPRVGLARVVLEAASGPARSLVLADYRLSSPRYREASRPIPAALVFGWHDMLPFCAGTPFPDAVSTWDMIGAALGRPVDLVRCETVEFDVPASAELVLEGVLDPGAGPGGNAVMRVQCITCRDAPILRAALTESETGPPGESAAILAYSGSAAVWNMLEDAGIGGVTDVWLPPAAAGRNAFVRIRKETADHAERAAVALWGAATPAALFRNVTVVDDDIDIRNSDAIERAMAYRVDAGAGGIVTFGPGYEEDVARDAPATRVLIDATLPMGRSAPPPAVSREMARTLRDRWAAYGLGLPCPPPGDLK